MVQRYIAFAWNHRIAESNSLAKTLVRRLKADLPDWQCALAAEGLQVYHSSKMARCSQSYLLDQNAGIVLGKVFEHRVGLDGNRHEVAFDKHETQKIQETRGQHLVERYWGRYVALLREEGGVHVRILRDPTGAMPCLLTKFRGIDVVCSHIDDCTTLGLINCAINWDHIAAYLWYDNMITKDTGLEGVRQIQAGECVAIGNDNATATFYWSPDRIHDARIVEDHHQAMRELRNVIQCCVASWTYCYESILHELSGGLDSAIVLACLSETSGLRVICENHFTEDARGDERAFAQKAACLAGRELIEIPLHSSSGTLESMLGSTKVATPTQTTLVHEIHEIREQIVKARGIEAIFSGQGGDHFFQSIKTPQIAAEYAWRHGLRPEILDIIADTSRFTRNSMWSVIASVLASGIFHRYESPYGEIEPPPFVSDAARAAMDLGRIRHPWIDCAKHLPGSKLLQIFLVIDSQTFYRVPCHYSDIVHPLISQPIIELCLQIPTYVQTYGGIDRALVRDAFTTVVPPEIIQRTTKGATTSYLNRILVGSLPFLQGYLLDGILAGEGLLDRRKTEARLTESQLVRDPLLLFPVLSAVRAEAWLRTWISDGQRAAT